MIITPQLIIEVGAVITALTIIGTALTNALNKLKHPINDIKKEIADMRKTDEMNKARIDVHEKRLNEHDVTLKAIESDGKMVMKSVALLLSHAETGNNTGEISSFRKELEEYLIER